MSKKQTLRVLINQRLSLAAAEIFELFERSIAEYEEQLCRSKEENQRQQKLLEAVYSPEVRLHRTDDHQLVVIKEELPTEQQEGNQELEQEESKLLLITDKEEELWSCQEGEQLQVLLKEETLQSSQEIRDSVEGPGSNRNSDLHTEDQSGDSAESEVLNGHHQEKEAHLVLKPSKTGSKVKVFECPQCGKHFNRRDSLIIHIRIHTGEKPFNCSLCGKRFTQRGQLKGHLRCHTGEKPYSCSFCGKRFASKSNWRAHLKCHTGEKRYSCLVCSKSYSWSCSLNAHMQKHTGEQPFTCKSCNKTFISAFQLKQHKCGGTLSVS